MIGRDEPMALVVQTRRHSNILGICYLGHATLDGNEMHRIQQMAEAKGCYAYTTTVEEDHTFESLCKHVEKIVNK